MNHGRVIIIGLDGVPFPLLKNLTQTGIMPNTGGIIQDGLFKPMRSSIPEISSVAWSSIITGQNPGQHGIFGFTDLVPGSYNLRFPNYYDLGTPAFWDLAAGKSIIINVPSTYPVREMNGVHISGFVAVDIRKSVHPASLVTKLEELDYRLDVDSQKAHKDLDLFMEDLNQTLAARIETYRFLWDYTDWQIFMLTFTATDRLMHFLWSAYEDESHRYHRDFLEHFRKIDEIIGEINERISESDTLILLSDHGFERLDKDIYINCFLKDKGFLILREGNEPLLSNIDRPTKAFALDPARIYINAGGKYPKGTVRREEKRGLINELCSLFLRMKIDNRNVIREVHRKENIYCGPYLANAPDLVLIANEGFNLKGSIASSELASRGIFTGKHTYQDAFLLTNNKEVEGILPEQPSVIDAGRIIQELVKNIE